MRTRLLFPYLHPSTFMEDDLEVLAERYEVRTFHFDARRVSAFPVVGLLILMCRQLIWLLRELPRAGLVYGWFADYHMFLPVLLAGRWKRPVAVAMGGFDAHHLPEIGYGVYHSRWRAPLARFVLRRASLLLPVAQSLIQSRTCFATWPATRSDGVLAHLPGLQTPMVVLPTGYDPGLWPAGPDQRPPVVGTAAWVSADRTVLVKGLDLLYAAARLLPEVSFAVVGISEERRRWMIRRYQPPANVEFLPPRPRQEMARFCAGLSVYLQISRTEGLPNGLCEAMLCGCIPVVSRVGGMPEAVGDAGMVVDSPEPEAIARALREALALAADPVRGPAARARARERIVTGFSRDRRRERLLALLQDLEERGSGHAPPVA
jgi:glycosyltransferase involved in cell wall biosynthesis